MLLTVSGPPGSGKSTIAHGVADVLGFDHVSGGDIFRALAEEEGLSLAGFNALAEEDDSIDRALDKRLRTLAAESEETILESRLAGWMAGEYADLKLWLDAPINVRATRIAEREGKDVEQAKIETVEREESEERRYRMYYGIESRDLGIYDAVLNTARWSPTETVNIVATLVERYDPSTDEGPFTVEGVSYEF